MTAPLRLVIYDDTCRGNGPLPGLTHSWIAGTALFRATGAIDAAKSATSWGEALDWLIRYEADQPIGEIQFWGHGKWGCAKIDDERLDVEALQPGHRHYERLIKVRQRLIGPEALWWFRTCETFGAEAGHEFARRWSAFFQCRVASHTLIIGPLQSGLHVIRPGEEPDWPVDEGIVEGTAQQPEKAGWSVPTSPNTITCLHGRLPDRFG